MKKTIAALLLAGSVVIAAPHPSYAGDDYNDDDDTIVVAGYICIGDDLFVSICTEHGYELIYAGHC